MEQPPGVYRESGTCRGKLSLSLFTHHKNKTIKRYLTFMDEMETKEVKSMIKEKTTEVAKNIEERHKIANEALIKIIEEVTEIKMCKIKR